MVMREVFCFALLTTVAKTLKCRGGAKCTTIKSCTGIYNVLSLGQNPQILKLLNNLHCGFDDNNNYDAMICCPPEFESATPVVGNRDNFPLDPENTEPGTIPGGHVCGIQTEGKLLAKHPWTALLRYDKTIGWGFFCGGVLISPKYVLTTASCGKGQDLPSNWALSQVRLGEWDTSSFADCYRTECSDLHIDVPIEKVIVHDNYDSTDGNYYNDIALLRLAQNVQFTDYIKPICLPMAATHTFEDYVAEVAGWGELESHSNSEVKKISGVPIIAAAECSNIFGRDINENQICAGGAKVSDTCLGDYGGALMGQESNDSNWSAIGLASYRPMSCRSLEFPSVYTRVDAYLDWILQKMEP